MAKTWEPCKYQKNNIGLHCETQNGCEKCGWNPKRAKEIHEKITRENIGKFNDKVFKNYITVINVSNKEVGEAVGVSESHFYAKRRGSTDWKLKDIISLANYFNTTPQTILEVFFNVPKRGGDTNG